MLIIWRGWGLAIVMAGVAAGMLVSSGLASLGGAPTLHALGMLLGGLVGGFAIGMIADRVESGPKRILVDQTDGRTFTVGPSAGSVFFVPTRYWAFVVPAVFAINGLSHLGGASV